MKWIIRQRSKIIPVCQYIKTIKTIPIAILILSSNFSFCFGQNRKYDSSAKTMILFVCEHGAARSTIATAYFNRLAKEKNLNYLAIFRGINPATSLSVETKKGLTEDGFDIKDWQPMPVSRNDINNAAEIITLDCNLILKDSSTRRIYPWNGTPPISESYQAARNYIVNKVAILIKELELKEQQKKTKSQ